MKRILLFVLVIMAFVAYGYGQKSNPFTGTWQYQNGNQVFMVKFWVEGNDILGRYKMITVDANGNQTSVIYKSTDKWGNSPHAPKREIYCQPGSESGTLAGLISDTTVNDPYSDFITGYISIKLLSGSSPMTASWVVTRGQGIKIEGEPDFNIHTNITLTKVSNTPYAD